VRDLTRGDDMTISTHIKKNASCTLRVTIERLKVYHAEGRRMDVCMDGWTYITQGLSLHDHLLLYIIFVCVYFLYIKTKKKSNNVVGSVCNFGYK
jgi:hypothetical protein